MLNAITCIIVVLTLTLFAIGLWFDARAKQYRERTLEIKMNEMKVKLIDLQERVYRLEIGECDTSEISAELDELERIIELYKSM